MKWVSILPNKVTVGGKPIETKDRGLGLLTELYRNYVNDYPKYFKMDGLCKLGFMASELLLQQDEEERFQSREDRAVILLNSTSSIDADQHFQATIRDMDNYFPSPSLFVYTLPNIVTGEIAIRNHYYGETSFYVIDEFSENTLLQVCQLTFCDGHTQSLICGWVDYANESSFNALLFLCSRKEIEYTKAFLGQFNQIKQSR